MSELFFALIRVLPDGSSELPELLTPDQAVYAMANLRWDLPTIQDGGSIVIRRATQDEIDAESEHRAEQRYSGDGTFAGNH